MTLSSPGNLRMLQKLFRPGRATAVLLGLALTASLAANVLLTRAARHYFELANDIRLDPAGLKVYQAERAKPAGDLLPIVLFGDSRALMWLPPAAPRGYRIVNRGVGFQTTAQMLFRFDADVAALRPAVVVVEGGVNDLKVIADFPDRRREIVAECEANLQRVVQACRHSGAAVVLVTVFAIGDPSLVKRPFWSESVADAVREVNAYLPTLANDGVIVFDANQVLGDGRGKVKREYQLDYLHLLPSGYEALNRSLLPLLPRLLPASPQ
jgi:lysophospholipase L1-like esterase